MDAGEHIEERAVGIAGEKQALGTETEPGLILSGYENQAETEGPVEPAERVGYIVLRLTLVRFTLDSSAGEGYDAAARGLQGEAAGYEDEGIEEQDSRDGQVVPVG